MYRATRDDVTEIWRRSRSFRFRYSLRASRGRRLHTVRIASSGYGDAKALRGLPPLSHLIRVLQRAHEKYLCALIDR